MMKRFASFRSSLAPLALGIAACFAELHEARAEEPDSATAQALFSSARKLADAGKFAAACPKFEESERIEPAIGTEFHLAKCWEQIGRNASAWAMFLRVSSQARAQNQLDRAELAAARARALEAKLARLKIEVRAKAPGLEVFRDGHELGSASFGEAVPLDPGEYEVSARAPGYEPFSTHVRLSDVSGVVTVEIPALVPRGPTTSPAQTQDTKPITAAHGSSEQETSPPEVAEATVPEPTSSLKPLGFVLGGVGLVSLGVGVGFALDFKHVCPNRAACQGDALSRAKTDRVLAYSGWAFGGAALAAGAILLLQAPARAPARTGWLFTPLCAPRACGASLSKDF